MRRVELEIEHHIDSRFVGRHKIRAGAGLTTIGTARDASIRLLGDQVSPFHACLEFDDENWILSDLQSEHGSWVRKKPVVEYPIKHSTVVQIGNHILKIVPKEINPTIFNSDESVDTLKDKKVFHQVVVRKAGYVLSTHLLRPNEGYRFQGAKSAEVLNPPKDYNWVSHKFADVEVQQRLVGSQILTSTSKEKLETLVDPAMQKPLGGAAVIFVLLLMVLFMAPDDSLDQMDEVKKPKVTKYTRIIYDSKATKQHKQKSKSISSNIDKNMKQQSQSRPVTGKTVTSKKVVKVVNKLKKSGLTQMIGRISKRSINTANLIKAHGQAASARSQGRALASVGSTANAASKAGKTENFRVGGVATGNKGGTSGFKGAGGLSLGGVGSSSVGILEEETIIQGGLAKDIIASVIKSHLGQIRYCYERQLSVAPNLYGKVLVKFVIGGDGMVSTQSIGTSTLNNSMVEGCVLRRVSRWKFPAPKGGTQVKVTYPFLFKSTN
tara:strand:- start:27225 stop:28706 length:1482 start_codon:yes stop_codon:yes gene_type:complete